MVLENWIKVREFEELGWARRNCFWVRDDQMPAVLLFEGKVVDGPPGPAVGSPWADLQGMESIVAAQDVYELWVLRRDEVRAGHILNMHHKVTFEINPTPVERRIVLVIFLACAFNLAVWVTLPFFVYAVGSLQAAFIVSAALSLVAVGLVYRWLTSSRK